MKKLIEKILDIQAALDVPKTRWNDFGGYNYRNCEDILQALKPLLIKQDLLQTLRDEVVEINGEAYVRATVTVTDGENSIEATALAREQKSRKKMDAAQLTGTASSYARKYALNGMWNIDDVKDPDTGAHNVTDNGNQDKSASDDEDPNWLNKTPKGSDELTDDWKKVLKRLKNDPNALPKVYDFYAVNKKNRKELEAFVEEVKAEKEPAVNGENPNDDLPF